MKKNAICLKLFWYKVFVHGKLKLVNFLMNVNLKTIWVRVRSCQNGHATPLVFNLYIYKVQRLFISALYVCGKLPTYPSLKPTFCFKWKVSINVSLRKGRWRVSQKRIIILSSLDGCDHAKNFILVAKYIDIWMPAWTTLHKNQFCCSVSCSVSINLINVFGSDCAICDVL